MDDRPLHPNLARLAAQYDEILRQYSVRQIDAATARNKIRALQARDDEGVVWSIDAESGEWMRRSRNGEWVRGTPPTSGFATPTAHDFSRDPSLFNPDSRISFTEASDAPNGLTGSTRVPTTRASETDPGSWRKKLAAGVLLGVAVLVGFTLCGDAGDTPPLPAPVEEPGPITGRPPAPVPGTDG